VFSLTNMMVLISVCAYGAPTMASTIGRIALPRYTITNAVELAPLPNLVAQYLESECLTENTRRTYSTGLEQFQDWLTLRAKKRISCLSYSDITRAILSDYKKHRLETGKPATAAVRLDTVKAFTAWASKRYHVDDPGERVAYIPKGEIDFRGLTPREVSQMLIRAKAERDPVARFLPCFLLYTGCRIDCEALSLKVGQVDLTGLYLHAVWGKGGRARNVPIDPEGLAEFERYINEREADGADKDSWLFPSPRDESLKMSYPLGRRIIATHNTHPHALRHTYAHRFLDREQKEGTDAFRAAIKLKRALGHSSIETTLIYLGVQPGTFETKYGAEMR